MAPIKIAFFDIDWTLFDHHAGDFTPSAISSIIQAKNRGVKIVIASGRAYHLIHRIGALEKIPYDAIIASNGACIYLGDTCVYQNSLNKEAISTLMKRMNEHQLLVELITANGSFINQPRNEAMDLIYFHYPADTPPIRPYTNQPILTGILFVDESKDELYQDLPLHFSRFHDYGVDVYDRTNHKGNALDRVLTLFNLSREESIAFGDDTNDIEMIQHAGIGVAMGNAHPQLKAVANFVTTPIGEDGIAYALKKFKVIE